MLEIIIARYLKTLIYNLLKYVVNSYKYVTNKWILKQLENQNSYKSLKKLKYLYNGNTGL